jgi:hypothetical protein
MPAILMVSNNIYDKKQILFTLFILTFYGGEKSGVGGFTATSGLGGVT